ncbi:MAG: hypothetical protein Q7S11_04905 [bacterium]|nr:hypothetical protein [bacterium]
MNRKIIVIGLTGQIGAGKGVLANILVEEFGFIYFSLSDRVRKIATAREQGPRDEQTGREFLQNIGNDARIQFGGEALAELTAGCAFADLAGGKDRIIFDGIRNPNEVSFLKRIPGFKLIAVIATQEKRFENVIARDRPTDPKSWKDFRRLDDRDLGIGENALGQNVMQCIEMADLTLLNADTKENFTIKVQGLANKLVGQNRRKVARRV